MSIHLLNLKSGTMSLELSEADIPSLKQAIADEFGSASEKPYVMMNEVSFGGETFVWQNELSDPCLISTTERGSLHLKLIYDALVADGNNTCGASKSAEES